MNPSGNVGGRNSGTTNPSGNMGGRNSGNTNPTGMTNPSGNMGGRNSGTTNPSGNMGGRNSGNTNPTGMTNPSGNMGGRNSRNDNPVGNMGSRNSRNDNPVGNMGSRNSRNDNPGGGRGDLGGRNTRVFTNDRPVYRAQGGERSSAGRDGGRIFEREGGLRIGTDRGGRVTTFERGGLKASNFRADGHPGRIENSRPDGSRIVVERGFRGERRVDFVRPDRTRIVTNGNRGFVERPFQRGYVARTYVYGGRTDVRVYREQTFGPIHYYRYVPRYYYQPTFYAWAGSSWVRPVAFGWGWMSSPWYGYYGGYFSPEPVYVSPALWLTDFVIAANLQADYEARVAANGGVPPEGLSPDGSVALSPEVKQQIALEVRQQLAAERAAAVQPGGDGFQPTGFEAPPDALDPRTKIFVVSSGIDLFANDQTCSLTPGDIIERTSRDVTPDGQVPISVTNSKDGDCPVDFAAMMDVSALQDMHNAFREQIASGMDQLAATQGRGLPAGPAASPRVVMAGTAQAAPDARALLSIQNSEAEKVELQVKLPPL